MNARWGSGPVQRLHQVPDALTANSHRGNHRHSQLPLQSGDIDLDAFFDRHIPEVEGHNRGHSPLQYLEGQVEVSLQIGGINDIDHHISAFGKDLAADLLHPTGGVERIDAGGIH